ncbi:DUF5067 domain-containing protein [Enterococcus plantarum]|nr:DUF5067 domain-containing protein [Enterococcus plantarum]MBO0467691.1 DUF5067 domain-containing protein [Enterococcus plantarum]
MKKTVVLSLVALSSIVLASCGNPESKEGSTKPSQSSTSKYTEEKKDETSGDFVKTAKDTTFDGKMLKGNSYSVKITNTKVIQPGEAGNEYGDKPVIAFWYDTIVSPDYKDDIAINPNTSWITNFKAVQDNDPNKVNELRVASLPDSQYLESQIAEIKPGGTVSNATAYELTDNETPVTLIAKSIIGTEYGKADFPLK